ncbi:MAG: VWA-like domain-containing protein [Lachnospiraceae bacterium]|nr:VWA-like domain-containing protein [Lachnospiraceae bacterium]
MNYPNALQTQQERELELTDICKDILANARNELYLNMRFLDVALSGLVFTPDPAVTPAGTDGMGLYFHSESLANLYRRGREHVNRLYLHSLMHCLFCHMYHKKQRDEQIWNLACDMAVEYMLDHLFLKCIHLPQRIFRREWYRKLEEGNHTLTAEYIYRRLILFGPDRNLLLRLEQEFVRDDHSIWGQSDNPRNPNQEQQKKWNDARERMQTEMETFSKEASDDFKSLEEQVQVENRKRYDYREFLRKFSVLKEEMKVDMDSFDYIFYNYGMNLYGNMPLIEHLETKEEQRVEDFIIVIDTSMSCKGELVQRFLEETYSVLGESESFFRKINIHIIQCDDQVQEDVVIQSHEALKDYMNNFTIRGEGGTDFRPAFAYVEELRQKKQFAKLKGLIYFTDGYGVFPARKPEYETAFVFMKEDYRDVDVPPWAIKLILDADEYLNDQNGHF